MNPNKDSRRATRIDNRLRSKDRRDQRDDGAATGRPRFAPVRAQRPVEASDGRA